MKTFQVETLRLPELDLNHRARTVHQQALAFQTQDLINLGSSSIVSQLFSLMNYPDLVSPFHDNTLDIGFQNHIEIYPCIFSYSPFLIFNIIKALQGDLQYCNLF